jgi:hypothetical protein
MAGGGSNVGVARRNRRIKIAFLLRWAPNAVIAPLRSRRGGEADTRQKSKTRGAAAQSERRHERILG